MNTAMTTTPKSLARLHTQRPLDSIAAMDRARDRYLAKLSRAEAEYFQTLKEITGAITTAAVEGATEPPQDAAPPPIH